MTAWYKLVVEDTYEEFEETLNDLVGRYQDNHEIVSFQDTKYSTIALVRLTEED